MENHLEYNLLKDMGRYFIWVLPKARGEGSASQLNSSPAIENYFISSSTGCFRVGVKEPEKVINIKELKHLRAKLAQSISELILSFERETDVAVREIEIKGQRMGGQKRRTVHVGIKLDLDD